MEADSTLMEDSDYTPPASIIPLPRPEVRSPDSTRPNTPDDDDEVMLNSVSFYGLSLDAARAYYEDDTYSID